MKLNAIGLLCADIEKSLAFYRMLGVAFGEYDPDEGHYSADIGGGIRLMLDSHQVAEMFVQDFAAPQGNDLITLAVEFDEPAAVDEAFTALTGAGHAAVREPFEAFWGQRYVTVADPDGNPVDLYATSA